MMRKLKPWAKLNDLPKIQQVGFYCVPTFWLGFRPTLVQLPFLPSSLLAYYRVILDPGFPLSCFCSHPPAPWVCVTFQSSPKWKVGCFPSERSFINWLLGVGMRIQHKIMLQSLSLQGSPFWGQRFPACSAGVKLGVGNSVDFSGHGREEPLHPTTCSRVRCKKMAPT